MFGYTLRFVLGSLVLWAIATPILFAILGTGLVLLLVFSIMRVCDALRDLGSLRKTTPTKLGRPASRETN